MKQIKIITLISLFLISITCFAQNGAWNGKITIQGMELPLVFNFDSNSCTLDSPSQGVKGIPAAKSIAADGTIKVDIKAIGASFEGTVD